MSWRGGSPEDSEQGSQDDQRRRMAALRNLAAGASRAPTQPRLPRIGAQPGQVGQRGMGEARTSQRSQAAALLQRPQQPRRRRRALTTGVIVLCIVALLAGVGVWRLRSGHGATTVSQPPMPAVRTIDLSVSNLSCPVDPAWSPDGTQIAVLVTIGDCTNQQTGGPEIVVFDARTGKMTQAFALNAIFDKAGLSTGLRTSSFAWTPDGSALVFTVGYDPYSILPPATQRGLFDITLATGAERFTTDPTPLPQTDSGQLTNSATLVWDIKSGKRVQTISELAPATAYTWGPNGALAPAPTGATGKDVVSVWQAGDLSATLAQAWNESTPPPPNQTVPQSFVFGSSAPHWSPDGRYLALPLTMGARLPGGANAFPITGCLYGLTLICQATPTAAPDKGFAAALAAFEKGWSPNPQQQQPPLWYSQDIVWRADGQELATLLPGQDFYTGNSTATVTIFNTRTGAKVRALTIKRVVVNASGSGQEPQIAWSPRGASLAALDYADATLTLWRAE